jgi:nicotinamidase-related amidase
MILNEEEIWMQTALMIIDMQRGMHRERHAPSNNPVAEDNIAALLAAWREHGRPIIHVAHLSRVEGGSFFIGSDLVRFQDRFAPQAGEPAFEKKVPDAFSNSGLERWLLARNIDHLVIVGVSTNISVEGTARSASDLGFAVTIATDATFTFEMPTGPFGRRRIGT